MFGEFHLDLDILFWKVFNYKFNLFSGCGIILDICFILSECHHFWFAYVVSVSRIEFLLVVLYFPFNICEVCSIVSYLFSVSWIFALILIIYSLLLDLCLHYQHLQQSGVFGTINAPTMTHHYSPNLQFMLESPLGAVHSVSLDKCIMTFIYIIVPYRLVSLP